MLTTRTEILAEGVTIHMGDAREIVPTLPRADAVVTSPPYGQQRDYGKKVDDWRALVSGTLCGVPSAPEAQILVNLGLVHRDGEVVPYWQPFLDDMRAAGWRHFGWYVWDQQFGLPGDWNGRLAPSHEFVFHFNRIAKQPNKTKPSVSVGRKIGKTALTQKDGTSSRASGAGDDVNLAKIPDSVIRVTREMSRQGEWADHPARFPENFARELVGTYSNPAQTIIDPFMGSGTTGVAAVKMGRRFIGIEIEQNWFDISCRRISDALARPDLFVESPARVRPPEPMELALNSTGRP